MRARFRAPQTRRNDQMGQIGMKAKSIKEDVSINVWTVVRRREDITVDAYWGEDVPESQGAWFMSLVH